jgi:serine/threonine-protein kinase
MGSEPQNAIERYALIQPIAAGGMAEVFLAKAFGSHGFEKLLAIKRILPDLARKPEFERRFIVEAKIAASLTHTNIVQVFDFGRLGGSLYLAMEYVDGLDLAALLRAYGDDRRQVPLGVALHIAIELCKGLGFAHARSVVHRDVSPSNILISRAGEVKIGDFGIALAARVTEGRRTKPGHIMGKWRYMSPEQVRGEELDERSDVFSTGIVIYELLTGERLFHGNDVSSVTENVKSMPIPRASSLRPDLPDALDGVLARALQRDPASRLGAMTDFLRALHDVALSQGLLVTGLEVSEVACEVLARDKPADAPAGPLPKAPDVAAALDDVIRKQLGEGNPDAGSLGRVTQRADAVPMVAAMGVGTLPPVELVRDALPDGGAALRFDGPAGDHTIDALSATLHAPGNHQTTLRPQRHAPLVGLAAAVLLLAGFGAYVRARHSRAPEVAPVPEARLRVESTPPLATVYIDGSAWPQPTPTTVVLPPGRAEGIHTLELRLDGYRAWRDEEVAVRAGEQVVYRPQLERLRARLDVRSDPPGAQVLLDGRPLGDTPLADDVPADRASHRLTLRRRGYLDLEVPVSLEEEARVVVSKRLVPTVQYGSIDLSVVPWADVYLGARKVGEAPVKGLRLPIGRHRLRLVNPIRGRQTEIDVEVPGKELYKAKLPD